MITPAIIGLGFSWFLVILSIWGYIALFRKTRRRWGFWLLLAIGWAMFGVVNILALSSLPAGAWYMTTLSILGYLFIILSAFSLVARIVNQE
jgi:hypothetical protein